MKDKLVPDIRFPEFEGKWDRKPLNKYLTVIKTKNKDGRFKRDEVLSVAAEAGVVNQIKYHGRSYAGKSLLPYNVVEKGDLVYTKSPLKAYPYGIVKENINEPGVVSTLYAVYRPKKNASGSFLDYYFYSADKANRYLKPLVNIGAKNDMKVNNATVLTGKVVVPALPEQQKIATFLYLVDQRLAAARRRVEVLEEWKRGVVQKVFQNLEKWPSTKLGNIADIQKGKGISKSDITENGSIKCIRYGELYTTYGEVIESVKSRTDVPKVELLLSQGGEVLVPASGETAIDIATAACILSGDVALGSDMNIITTKIDGRFLAYQLSGPRKLALARLAQGVSVMHIYGKQLKEIVVSIPDSDEQNRIAETLISADARITTAARTVALLEEWKQGLLQKILV